MAPNLQDNLGKNTNTYVIYIMNVNAYSIKIYRAVNKIVLEVSSDNHFNAIQSPPLRSL